MRPFFAIMCMAGMATASAQPIVPNGTFSDSLGNCSAAHWSSFCDATMLTFGCNNCALGIAPNFGPNPCPYATTPTGMHTRLENVPVGSPMELSFCSIVDNSDGGNVGIFHTEAGVTPTWYYGDGIISTWPVFGATGTPMNNLITFTIPTALAGKDFWLFLEYSYAPDITPEIKVYDDLVIQPAMSTAIAEPVPVSIVLLDPAQGTIALTPALSAQVIGWEVMSITGACMARNGGDALMRTDAWAPGIYLVRARLRDGTLRQQRVML